MKNAYYYLPEDGISDEYIMKCIERKLSTNGRMDSLESYYKGLQPIFEKTTSSNTMPNNRVLSNYCHVIADFFASTITGKPIEYDCNKSKDMELVQEVFDDNDIESEDSRLSTALNIFGLAYEQVSIDDSGSIKFTEVDPRCVIVVRDRNVIPTPRYVIKVYKYCTEDEYYMVEVYNGTEGTVAEYKYYSGNARLTLQKKHSYVVNKLPFIEVVANEYQQSTFEQIKTLQDAYNKLLSLQIDDYEGFVDSFLGIYNAGGTTDEDIANMKANRVLLLDGDSKAEWIVKNSNPALIEEIKTSLEKNIHQISLLPDFSDENFSGNSSGVAIKYKMFGANNVVAQQQRGFSKAINSRLQFIIDYLNAKNATSIEKSEFTFQFKSLQVDEDESITDMINTLYDKIPISSLVKDLSFTTARDVDMVRKADKEKFEQSGSQTAKTAQEDKTAQEGKNTTITSSESGSEQDMTN